MAGLWYKIHPAVPSAGEAPPALPGATAEKPGHEEDAPNIGALTGMLKIRHTRTRAHKRTHTP